MENLNVLNKLKDFDLITFDGSCVSWNTGLWTVSRTTEKAILIYGEWLPKSQIVSVSMVERNKYDVDFNFETVTVPELCVNKWFDEMNDNKRGKCYGF